jgi:glycerophosphoryl diester phosphodiesterase
MILIRYVCTYTGADYVEPDIVLTKDRIPVCYHDIALKRSTDIESRPEFAALRGNHNVIIDGKNKTIYDDWLVIHLTLDELKTLRIQQQPNGVRLQDFNDLYEIITFQEFLDAIHEISFKLGKPIGIIPELKHPVFHNTVFNQQERFMETLLLSMLQTNGYPLNNGDASNCKYNSEPISCGPIILQNFDKNTVQYFSTVTSYPMVELMTLIHPDVYLLTPRGFEEIANFTHYICLWKEYMYTGVELEIIFRGENFIEYIDA